MWIGALLLCGAGALAAAMLIDRGRTPAIPPDRAMCWVCGRIVPLAQLTTRGCQACAVVPRPARTCADCGAPLPERHAWTRCEPCFAARVVAAYARRQAPADDDAIGRLLRDVPAVWERL